MRTARAGARLDHVVLRVADLQGAARDFETAGFTVTPGGRHPAWGSENALLVFADDSYLELIRFAPGTAREPRLSCMRRLAAQGRGLLEQRVVSWGCVAPGLVDHAARAPRMPELLERLRRSGMAAEGPVPGSRERPDGQRLAWRMGVPATLDLPFLCADVTPQELRIPQGPARVHANGARGIARLDLLLAEPDLAPARLEAFWGEVPEMLPDGGCRLQRDGCTLRWRGVRTEPERAHLQARGAGPWSLTLAGAELDARALLDHGLRLLG